MIIIAVNHYFKTFLVKISVDLRVSIISENKFFLSPRTSSLTTFNHRSLASLRVLSASVELKQPAVLEDKNFFNQYNPLREVFFI